MWKKYSMFNKLISYIAFLMIGVDISLTVEFFMAEKYFLMILVIVQSALWLSLIIMLTQLAETDRVTDRNWVKPIR